LKFGPLEKPIIFSAKVTIRAMLCSICHLRLATRYGTYPGLVTPWCDVCSAGHGRPLRAPWLRPLTIMWTHFMNLRGGRRARKERLAKAAREKLAGG